MESYKRLFKEEIIVDELGFSWDTELQNKLKALNKGEHHKIVCPSCERVTSQCRCPSDSKTIISYLLQM